MKHDYDLMTRLAESSANSFFEWYPRPKLTPDEWQSCRLIAHRGCHDSGATIYENTLPAFDAACQAGIWGIEFDVHFTRDRLPVVIHDPNTANLPGASPVEVERTDFDELRKFTPMVPRLEEVVERYAGKMHLMIELKGATLNSSTSMRLSNCLSKLEPTFDFHIMSLDPKELRSVREFPTEALLLIATTNTRQIYSEFLKGEFGGLTGHYLLLNSKMRKELAMKNVPWGTGYINSVNLLAREIRSGTKWMFSNAADKLVHLMNQAD